MLSAVVSPHPQEYTVVMIAEAGAERPPEAAPRRLPAALTMRHLLGFRLFDL